MFIALGCREEDEPTNGKEKRNRKDTQEEIQSERGRKKRKWSVETEEQKAFNLFVSLSTMNDHNFKKKLRLKIYTPIFSLLSINVESEYNT